MGTGSQEWCLFGELSKETARKWGEQYDGCEEKGWDARLGRGRDGVGEDDAVRAQLSKIAGSGDGKRGGSLLGDTKRYQHRQRQR